jgi:hypothetical protein
MVTGARAASGRMSGFGWEKPGCFRSAVERSLSGGLSGMARRLDRLAVRSPRRC